MDLGVFIPIGSNGWLISTTSPRYQPSLPLNPDTVLLAERYGFGFALSMVKLRGFGGQSEFWDHCLESFTLMAGIASVTSRIKLIASSAVLTMPPALAARMGATVDSIAPGRFGINIVSGWQEAEYSQMGLWPGQAHFQRRYEYCAEYVTILRDLWSAGVSDFQGEFFQMKDCRLSPRPSSMPAVVAAGQSGTGIEFAARYADYNFCMGEGVNTPAQFAPAVARLVEASARTGRTVGAYALFMVIADETDAKAQAKWELYKEGKDMEALGWMGVQAAADDKADMRSTARHMTNPVSAVNFNMGTLVGSYATVAALLDEVAAVAGVAGIMLTFDDFLLGMEAFGQEIQPLMASRRAALAAA